MYSSTAIFIKILQRRSQFRRVNIFRCYTFINSAATERRLHEIQVLTKSGQRQRPTAMASQSVSTILVFMAIMLTSRWLACFYTCCNTHLRLASEWYSVERWNKKKCRVLIIQIHSNPLLSMFSTYLCMCSGIFFLYFLNRNNFDLVTLFPNSSMFIKSTELYTLFLSFVHILFAETDFPFVHFYATVKMELWLFLSATPGILATTTFNVSNTKNKYQQHTIYVILHDALNIAVVDFLSVFVRAL